ncbi:MAG TPA: prolyl oligopeptidase family serine peptidase, partial [Pyrinomonadaceae bacterium]|nr:prolyl oligopeptidase family serine peptidase [Pyrinomonadaceae bacterium]
MKRIELFGLGLVLLAVTGLAQSQTIDRYLNIRSAGGPALSPAGDRVAFLTNITGTPQVWMVSAGGGWPEQMTFYADRVDAVEWSPDGSGLIFAKAQGGDENAQLFWLSVDGAQTKALTDAPKVRHNFGAWSHDGKRISYASNRRDPNFFDIYVMDVVTGREELVYQQDGSNDFVAWSFDDRQIVISRSNEQLSLDNDLYLVDVPTKQVTHLTPHEGPAQFENAFFSRDGRALLLATNRGREWASLARLDLGTKAVEILDETPLDVDAAAFAHDARSFAYTFNRDGYSELYLREVSPDGRLKGKSAPIKLPAAGVVSGLSFSRDANRLGFAFNSAGHNPDVWLCETKGGAPTQLTRSSRAGIPQSSFVAPELVRYKSFDGREVPAWYYRPPKATNGASSAPPVIVSVHGGPEGQERPSFSALYQYFLSRGYAVLAPNVRGSTGYGKTYTHLDDVRRREDSVKDLAAGVEWLKGQEGGAARKIAVMGGS